jgi:hypothetical protein
MHVVTGQSMPQHRKVFIPLLAYAVLGVTTCSRVDEPRATRAAASAPAPSGMAAASSENRDAAAAPAREIVWNDPFGWEKVSPSSPMRKATYRVPPAPKDPEGGEMAVFFFRGEGGSTEANIQRWIAQFLDAKPSDVKRAQRTINGMSQTIVEIEGTFASGMPGEPPTPKPKYRLIGTVVETPVGPYFFKLTGPRKTVEAAREAYLAMLESIHSS